MLELSIIILGTVIIVLPFIYWAVRPRGTLFNFGLDACYFPKAGITSILHPLATKNIKPKTNIKIIGSKCPNLKDSASTSSEDYPKSWENKLEQWAAMCEGIEYLLIEPDESSWKRLKDLSAKDSKIKAYRISKISNIVNSQTKTLAQESLTSHFVLFTNPEQMWLEGNHPLESNEAYDCEFVNRAACKDDWRFSKLTSVFEDLKSEASEKTF